MVDFEASADIRGQRIDVSFAWVAPGDRPRIRLVRRRYDIPNGPTDGLVAFDTADYFPDPTNPHTTWDHIERDRYLVINATTEGGSAACEVAYYFLTANGEAAHATVTIFDALSRTLQTIDIPDVSHRTTTTTGTTTTTLITTVSSSTGGTLTVSSPGTGSPAGPHHVSWTPSAAGSTTIGSDYDWLEVTTEKVTSTLDPQGRYIVNAAKTTNTNLLLRQITLTETLDPTSNDWTRGIAIADLEPSERAAPPLLPGLAPERPYAYAAFVVPAGGTAFQADPAWSTAATPTADYGLQDRLYRLLPAIHRYLDEPAPTNEGKGQLRRFLQIFGGGLNQMRSRAEALTSRQDVYHASFERLHDLARWIGWNPDETVSGRLQRNDILMAPAIFESLGTIPSIQAIVNRATPIGANGVSGWDIKVKEFANNILVTNAVEPIQLWEIWESDSTNGTTWTAPTQRTQTDFFDGRPTAAIDSGGVTWLFWHSDQSGRRELWVQRLSVDPAPVRVMGLGGASDDSPNARFVDEYPAAIADGTGVRVFWSSNRNGQWNIWTRKLAVTAGAVGTSALARVTDSVGSNRNPAVIPVVGSPTKATVLWQSDRRGFTDIWEGIFDTQASVGTLLGNVTRVSTSDGFDTMPAGVTAGSVLQIYFARAEGNTSRILAGPIAMGISGATLASPIVVTTSAPHGLVSGQVVTISGVLGNTAANGTWTTGVVSPTQLSLTGSVGNASYVSGGTLNVTLDIFASFDASLTDAQRAHIRDEAPAVASLGGVTRLFWHSNRDGRWRIWQSVQQTTTTWSAPAAVTLGQIEADKEPAALVSTGTLRLFLRTQRSGRRFRSRTVDTKDLAAVQRGNVADKWHYTYDCGTFNTDWYSRNTVGIYMSPPAGSSDAANQQLISRISTFMEPFRPISARFVWLYKFDNPTAI